MATEYDYTNGSIQWNRPIPLPVSNDKITPVKSIVDFSLQTLDAGEADIGVIINIPADTTVLYCTVLPREDGDGSLAPTNSTIDIGVTGSTAKWGSGLVLDTEEYNVATSGGVAPTLAPHYYETAGTIIVTATIDDADVDISTGRAEIIAYCINH